MPQLDGLRCLAVLVVVIQHTAGGRLFPRFGVNGFGVYGVWLFFVLSGFLITGILMQLRPLAEDGQSGHALRTFYARRALRIFPLYYAVLAYWMFILRVPALPPVIGWHLAYLGNWLMAVRHSWTDAGTVWSLAVEEQFYLFWPALVLFTPARRLASLLIALCVVGVLSRAALVALLPADGINVSAIVPTTSNFDALGLGSLLAWARLQRATTTVDSRQWTNRALVAGVALLAIVALLSYGGRGTKIVVVIETLGASLIAVWLVDRTASGFPDGGIGERVFNNRAARYVGTISYGFYLLHFPAMDLLSHLGLASAARAPGTAAALTWCLEVTATAVALASASWFLFERPINALKRHWQYPRSARAGRGESTPLPALDAASTIDQVRPAVVQ